MAKQRKIIDNSRNKTMQSGLRTASSTVSQSILNNSCKWYWVRTILVMRLNLTTQLYGICEGNKKSNIRKVWLVDGFSRLWLQSSYVQMADWKNMIKIFIIGQSLLYTLWAKMQRYYLVVDPTKSRQGTEQTRTFDPSYESADCWSADTVIISLSE